MKRAIVLANKFPLEVLDEDKKHLKDVDSIGAASRYCNLKDSTGVWQYLFIKQKTNRGSRTKGVLSKVTGKRYHFKLK